MYEDFVDIYLGHHLTGLLFPFLASLLKLKIQIGNLFWGMLKFQIRLGHA